MTFRNTLSQFWFNIQYRLFPLVEEQVETISGTYKKLISILELVRIEQFLPCYRFIEGRPVKDRACIARAFIAKQVLKLTYTKQLVDLLHQDKQLRVICGWSLDSQLPSMSKFSRAFQEFAAIALPDRVHQALVSGLYQDKIVGHLGYDSTAIEAREKAAKKEGTRAERKLANQRYSRENKGKLGRKGKQMQQPLYEMLEELPSSCDFGMKMNSRGVATVWKGYKFHVSTDDHGIPITAILTSVSLNDCEAAIPLMAKTNKNVRNFYDLMDSAYDVSEIKEYSRQLGRIPIIDKHARSVKQKEGKEAEAKRKHLLNAYTAEDKRYKNRFPKERSNSLLKEYFGGRRIQYKGHAKVFCHLMFGMLVCASTLVIKLLN